jgi:hypothetical protein
VPWSGDVAVLGAIQAGLLVRVVAVEVGIILVGLGLYLGHGAWSTRAVRRSAARLAQGRGALQAALDVEEAGQVEPGRLAELPRRLQIEVLAGVAPRLAGAQRQRVTALAAELGLLALAQAWCHSRLWWRRLRGARLCTLLGGGTASVPPLLGDRRPEVRAQAAEWAVEYHNDEIVELLLQMLDVDDGSTRFTVKDSLIRIGRPLTERLAFHLSGRAGPSLGPALEVAVALPDPVLLPAALALCHDEDPRIRALAAGLAGAIGGGPAVEVLMGLLGDEAPETRASAARALGRAGHWAAAASLAGLLGDRSWDVRRQASVALRTLGSPGMLFLREALSARDPFAADAARHALDLPDSALRTL